ncbi:MAG: vWA domain-containing protein [Candidatus Loosdrechtia sp.]|uniref:vWA domain-containing protein n=1 Tax=Candidatus Loosdrechtia sp. TaxID=3101272 RepID=UPI003A6B2CA2|nr:MAG: VWA domain-containing protein [Candidatus Jettenia sp. AMX2]
MLFFYYEQYKIIVYTLSGLIFILYLVLHLRKNAWLKAFGQRSLINRFSRIPGIHRNLLKGMSISAAFCAMSLVILQPKWQTTQDYYEKEGLEIVFVLDVSVSMLAEDVKPNRLQRAKMEITNLVRELEEDRVGLVVFAARAFSLLPYPTKDYERVFLRILNMVNESYVRFVPYGTNIGNALILAMNSYSKENAKKVMIFLTDGEEQIITRSQVAEAVKLLLERKDIAIYIIGIGDPLKASPIPKKDKDGNVIGYEVTEDEEIITTKPDPKFLAEIAQMVGGTYQHDATGNELKHIFRQVIEQNRNIAGIHKKNIMKDISLYFLGGALALLTIYFLL